MNTAEWQKAIQLKIERVEKSEEQTESAPICFESASEQSLLDLESHLGCTLPASYRALLKVSNGIDEFSWFIERLLPSDEIEWFSVQNSDWIDCYVEGDPALEDLRSMLQISSATEGAVLLLNPLVQDALGEWQGVFFANWNPGDERYDSLDAMVYKVAKIANSSRADHKSARANRTTQQTANQIKSQKKNNNWTTKPIEVYVEQLKDSNPRKRIQAIGALELLRTSECIIPLVNMLSDPNLKVRCMAAKALRNFGEERVISALKQTVIKADEDELRGAAITSLVAMKNGLIGGVDEQFVELLCSMLTTSRFADYAAKALGILKSPAAVRPMVDALRMCADPGDIDVDRSLIPASSISLALGSIGGDVAFDAVLSLLDSQNSALRIRAAIAVGYMNHPQVGPLLRKLACDSDRQVRAEAERRLGTGKFDA